MRGIFAAAIVAALAGCGLDAEDFEGTYGVEENAKVHFPDGASLGKTTIERVTLTAVDGETLRWESPADPGHPLLFKYLGEDSQGSMPLFQTPRVSTRVTFAAQPGTCVRAGTEVQVVFGTLIFDAETSMLFLQLKGNVPGTEGQLDIMAQGQP